MSTNRTKMIWENKIFNRLIASSKEEGKKKVLFVLKSEFLK